MPYGYGRVFTVVNWLWMLSCPATVALWFLTKWWIAVLFFLLVPRVLRRTAMDGACEAIVQYAADDPEFKSWAFEHGLLNIPDLSIVTWPHERRRADENASTGAANTISAVE